MRIVCALRDIAQPVQETRKKKIAKNAKKRRKRIFMVEKVEKDRGRAVLKLCPIMGIPVNSRLETVQANFCLVPAPVYHLAGGWS